MFGDLLRGAASIVGSIVGTVVGVSVSVISTTLGITAEMAQEALDAGCETYEEIRDHFDLD